MEINIFRTLILFVFHSKAVSYLQNLHCLNPYVTNILTNVIINLNLHCNISILSFLYQLTGFNLHCWPSLPAVHYQVLFPIGFIKGYGNISCWIEIKANLIVLCTYKNIGQQCMQTAEASNNTPHSYIKCFVCLYTS